MMLNLKYRTDDDWEEEEDYEDGYFGRDEQEVL